MTAASCCRHEYGECDNDNKTKYTIKFGFDISRGAITKTVKSKYTIPHPNFNKTSFENDIMLIIMEEPIEFTQTVGPICLPEEGLEECAYF